MDFFPPDSVVPHFEVNWVVFFFCDFASKVAIRFYPDENVVLWVRCGAFVSEEGSALNKRFILACAVMC